MLQLPEKIGPLLLYHTLGQTTKSWQTDNMEKENRSCERISGMPLGRRQSAAPLYTQLTHENLLNGLGGARADHRAGWAVWNWQGSPVC